MVTLPAAERSPSTPSLPTDSAAVSCVLAEAPTVMGPAEVRLPISPWLPVTKTAPSREVTFSMVPVLSAMVTPILLVTSPRVPALWIFSVPVVLTVRLSTVAPSRMKNSTLPWHCGSVRAPISPENCAP